MRTDKTNIHVAPIIMDFDDKAVTVAFDVENYPVIGNDADSSITRFDIGW